MVALVLLDLARGAAVQMINVEGLGASRKHILNLMASSILIIGKV